MLHTDPEYIKLTHRWPLQKDCTQFYGNPHSNSFDSQHLVTVPCPWKLFYEGNPVTRGIRINKKCADSLKRVLESVWNTLHQDQSAVEALRYHLFSGSFAVRPKRGGSTLSMHAYGCAIDWDDEDNPHHATRHLFTDESPLIQAFYAEGWIWGGDWYKFSVDAMHVQAARVY